MNRPDTGNNKNNNPLNLLYAPTPTRFARNQNNNTQPPPLNPLQLLTGNTSLTESREKDTANSMTKQLPIRRVSNLDKNVLFQDIDLNPTQSAIKKSVDTTATQSANQSVNSQPGGINTMGVIGNVFLGSTNKFVKGFGDAMLSTPNKNKEIPQQQKEEKVYQIYPPSGRLNRNKEVKESSEKTPALEIKSRVNSAYESVTRKEGAGTDRSNNQGRKIERKPERSRQLRFLDKKDQSVILSQSQISVDNTPVRPIKINTMTQQIQTVVAVEEIATEPTTISKPSYQPIQRNKPNPVRSRLIQQPASIFQTVSIAQPEPTQQLQANQQKIIQQDKKIVKIGQIRNQNLTESKVKQVQVSPPSPPQITAVVKPSPYRSNISKKVQVQSAQHKIAPKQIIQNASQVESENNVIHLIEVKDQQKQQLIKQTLKKTSVIMLTVKRLLKNKIQQSFKCLLNNRIAKRFHFVNQCALLSLSANQILKNKQANLIKLGFQNLKKKFTNPYIASLKAKADSIPIYKPVAAVLLDRLYQSKLRDIIKKLKTHKDLTNNKIKVFANVDVFYRKKTKTILQGGFDLIKVKAQSRMNTLQQLASIVYKLNKNKTYLALNKLWINKNTVKTQIKQSATVVKAAKVAPIKSQPVQQIVQDNAVLIQKLSKLKKDASSAQQEANTLQTSIKNKKKQAQTQKTKLNEKIAILKNQNEQTVNEIDIRRHRNQQIQKQMQSKQFKKAKPAEFLEEFNEGRQSKLELLTNLYITNYKNVHQVISSEQIANNYDIKSNDSNTTLTEWQTILQNIELKRSIASYQGVDPKEFKARSYLIQEQNLIGKLIRSYIKEQYFWSWVHLSAQN